MNFPLFISRRYLFSKKSTHAINLISFVSMMGVAVATMALVVTLSVFNGFHDLVATLFTSFDPQIEITATKGKAFPADDARLEKVKRLSKEERKGDSIVTVPIVEVATEIVEDKALAVYHGQQAMVTVMGVEDNFDKLTNINRILYPESGEFQLQRGGLEYGVLGIRLAERLGTTASFKDYLHVYAPLKEGQLMDLDDPSEAFVEDSLCSPGVVFNVQQGKYDKGHIITSIDFARNLFGQQGMITSLALRLRPGSDIEKVKKEIDGILNGQNPTAIYGQTPQTAPASEQSQTTFLIKDRYEQQEETFSIMKIEKLLAFIFLTFILVVASFNIIGSLSMLMIDKKEDTETLKKLGATEKQVAKIFLYEGRMIAAIGALLGIGIGLLLCWLQQEYGFVALGQSQGSFIVDAYPVSVHAEDVIAVFFTVVAVSWVATWYPVKHFAKRQRV